MTDQTPTPDNVLATGDLTIPADWRAAAPTLEPIPEPDTVPVTPAPDFPVQTVALISPDRFTFLEAIRTPDGWLTYGKPEETTPGTFVLADAVHVWDDADVAEVRASKGTWNPMLRDLLIRRRKEADDARNAAPATTPEEPVQ